MNRQLRVEDDKAEVTHDPSLLVDSGTTRSRVRGSTMIPEGDGSGRDQGRDIGSSSNCGLGKGKIKAPRSERLRQ
jgi:hypothetical protein